MKKILIYFYIITSVLVISLLSIEFHKLNKANKALTDYYFESEKTLSLFNEQYPKEFSTFLESMNFVYFFHIREKVCETTGIDESYYEN